MRIEELLTLSEIRPGMILARDVEYNGEIILTKGLVFSDEIISLLSGSVEVERYPVIIEQEEEGILPVFSPEEMVVETVRELYMHVRLLFEKSRSRGKLIPEEIEPLKGKVQSLVCFFNESTDLFQLVKSKDLLRYEISHTTNKIMLAIMLCSRLEMTEEQQVNAALAAAFSDLGITAVDESLLFRKERLKENDYDAIREHIFRSIAIVQESLSLPDELLTALVQHHERFDGSGYPKGLSGDEIHPVGLVIGLSDMFGALISDRPFRAAYSTYDTMRYILYISGRLFPPHLVNALFRLFTFYPPNTMVRLNTGEMGTVIYVNEEKIMRPVVRILFGSDGRKLSQPFLLDLTKSNQHYIIKVVK